MNITENALLFLDENHQRNDREWFARNKENYKTLVEAPMLALSESLGPTIRKIDPSLATDPRRTLSRIWKDTRFSKDKSFFKKSVWITFQREKGLSHPVYFFEFCSDFHRYGCGYYATPAKIMTHIQQQVLAGGKLFRNAQSAMKQLPHFEIDGDTYKRPKYPDQTPELRKWLERKSVTAMHTNRDRLALYSENLPEVLADAFIKLAPVYEFLTRCHMEALEEQEFQTCKEHPL